MRGGSGLDRGTLAGAAAALGWILLCLRWFDVAAPWRAAGLGAVPPAVLGVLFSAALGAWLHRHRDALWPALGDAPRGALLVVGLAIAFRLPLAAWAAAGYTTADASMAGIMALRIRDGAEHLVFIPNLSYCGSLKSHLTVPLMAFLDAPRAFALASIGFYALFALAVYRMALLLAGPAAALGAGLWAAFAPTYVTQYSLSNDGNYVEVLALGTTALLLTAQWLRQAEHRPALAAAIGVLLGLAFWCHVLGVIHCVAVAASLLLLGGLRPALGSAPALAGGFALGNLPALLWNARHGWASFLYLLPSEYRGSAESLGEHAASGPGVAERLWLMLTDHGPLLMGYDPGYPAALDVLSRGLAWTGLIAALAAGGSVALRCWRRRAAGADAVLPIFALTNVAVLLVALPHVPGNPRYALFLVAPAAVWLPALLDRGLGRALLALLVAFGALGSMGQLPPKRAADVRWRGFVSELEAAGVRHCYTDYYIAARLDFFSEERLICAAGLGPTPTDYFEYRPRVDAAAEAALIPVNRTAGDKVERRLARLGIAARRLELMKPVILPERKVTPEELFPQRAPAGPADAEDVGEPGGP